MIDRDDTATGADTPARSGTSTPELLAYASSSSGRKIRGLRWYIAGLLMLATTVNYLDRQTLSVAAPPPLAEAAAAAGCPAEGIRALQADGRLVRIGTDLAWATPMYRRLAAMALDLARVAPLTPATLRDATDTSRKYVLAILEDLDRREILRRTPEGHIPGPRAPQPRPVAAEAAR